jgi:hypothetical protein
MSFVVTVNIIEALLTLTAKNIVKTSQQSITKPNFPDGQKLTNLNLAHTQQHTCRCLLQYVEKYTIRDFVSVKVLLSC